MREVYGCAGGFADGGLRGVVWHAGGLGECERGGADVRVWGGPCEWREGMREMAWA